MARQSLFCPASGTRDPRPTATGWIAPHLPPGPQRDEALALLRVGMQMSAAWTGRRPGPLARLVRSLVAEHQHMSLDQLLALLNLEALKREHLGEAASCIESVNRGWRVVTYHDGKTRAQVGFAHVGNLLSTAKKWDSRESLTHESDPLKFARCCAPRGELEDSQ